MKSTSMTFVAICSAFCFVSSASSQIFVGSMEEPVIEPLIPRVNTTFQLPAGPATTQFNWLLGELVAGETTTAAEVSTRFTSDWFAQVANQQQTADFINSIRGTQPNARITDLIRVSPISVVAVVGSPNAGTALNFMTMDTRFSSGLISGLSAFNGYSGTAVLPVDSALTLTQAVTKFGSLSPQNSLYIGRIGAYGQCSATETLNPTASRSISIAYRPWVIGGLAREFQFESINASATITQDGLKNFIGSALSFEPNGTVYSYRDLATIVGANSDATASDMLHQAVGRANVDRMFTDFQMGIPTDITPLLGRSEQAHLWFTVTAANRAAYVTGSEAFQQNFLNVQQGRYAGGGGISPLSELSTTSWKATAADFCRAFAALRRFPEKSPAMRMIDRAMGSSVGFPNVRNAWDRSWFTAATLGQSNVNLQVLIQAWMLEDQGRDPFVLIAISNDPNGGILADGSDTATLTQLQSTTARILEILAAAP
jgi:hypothetical protein